MSIVAGKIMDVDTASWEYTGEFWASGWYVVTSANAASLEMTDENGCKVIRAVSAISSERMIPGPPLAAPVRIKNLKVHIILD